MDRSNGRIVREREESVRADIRSERRRTRGAPVFGVAVNPDGSIHICPSNEAMAFETEQRANELGIDATVSRECEGPVRYWS